MQNFLSLWLNAGAQITHGGQVQRPRQMTHYQVASKVSTKKNVSSKCPKQRCWSLATFCSICNKRPWGCLQPPLPLYIKCLNEPKKAFFYLFLMIPTSFHQYTFLSHRACPADMLTLDDTGMTLWKGFFHMWKANCFGQRWSPGILSPPNGLKHM